MAAKLIITSNRAPSRAYGISCRPTYITVSSFDIDVLVSVDVVYMCYSGFSY